MNIDACLSLIDYNLRHSEVTVIYRYKHTALHEICNKNALTARASTWVFLKRISISRRNLRWLRILPAYDLVLSLGNSSWKWFVVSPHALPGLLEPWCRCISKIFCVVKQTNNKQNYKEIEYSVLVVFFLSESSTELANACQQLVNGWSMFYLDYRILWHVEKALVR